MNIKEQLLAIELDFSRVEVKDAKEVQKILKKLERHFFLRLGLLLLFSCAQVALVLLGIFPFGFITVTLSILPFFEIYRIWPLGAKIYLYQYLYNLIFGDAIKKEEEEGRKNKV
ncbi:MAG: hypothetical protein FJZ66_00125 [Bacteroidetes bacterium]|nr:hypothetical protein [Bacteroidota bacterium]